MPTKTITCMKQPNCCCCCFFHWVPSWGKSTLENLRILEKKMFITVSLQRQQHFTSTIRILQLCSFLGKIDLFSLCALFSHFRSRDATPENFSFYCCPIRHVHISHNAPYFPSVFCISIVFNFSWDGCDTRGKWKTKVTQNLGGQKRCIMGNMEVACRTFSHDVTAAMLMLVN